MVELIKIKRIPEIDKSYYKTTKIICDKCNKEIGENDEYLEVNYMEKHYDDELSYKHFCEKCMKDSMYDMFINNHYTSKTVEFFFFPFNSVTFLLKIKSS